MKLLLDTHALLWAWGEPERLKAETTDALADDDNAVFVSVVSLWEIVIKCRVGKLQADITSVVGWLAPFSKIRLLEVQPRHLIVLDGLNFHQRHRDPFDHLIIAQAIAEGMTLVTQDQNAALYPVPIMAP